MASDEEKEGVSDDTESDYFMRIHMGQPSLSNSKAVIAKMTQEPITIGTVVILILLSWATWKVTDSRPDEVAVIEQCLSK